METVSRDWVFAEKAKNRKGIKGLEYHADGASVHLGKISPGCRICFTAEDGGGIQIGNKCNRKCSTCYYSRDRDKYDITQPRVDDMVGDFFRMSLDPNWKPWAYAYQSSGETMLYLKQMLPIAAILKRVKANHGIEMYHHMYSNGELLNEERLEMIKFLGVNEIRFHLSASKWSEKVFRNMEIVRDAGITVSVEEPSYPIEWDNIMDHLATFEEIGVKHVNMVEVQITKDNLQELEAEYPNGKKYKDYFYHIYDEGMVYEVMRQVEKNNYSFSVMDCSGTVETYRQMKNQELGFTKGSIEGMCAPFDYGDRDEDKP